MSSNKNGEEIDFRKLILHYVATSDYRPCRTKEMARYLGVRKDDIETFRTTIGILKDEHKLKRDERNCWIASEGAAPDKFVDGMLRVTRAGNGFLIPDDPTIDDLYIGENYLGAALDGDKVRVRIDSPSGVGYRHFARVVEVIERGTPRFVAVVTDRMTALPEDPKNPYEYKLKNPPAGLRPDTKVIVDTIAFPGDGKEPEGKVVEILGPAGEPDTETAAILAGFQAPGPFPESVKQEVRNIAASNPLHDRAGRLDITKTITVTIDPDTARDFDDALSYEIKPDGTIRVGVHIADVSHFVRPGSELDREALERSTSIYLPGRVIPMLPEELSNDLCSLRPREDRFTKTVFIDYDSEGNRKDYHIHRTVICSRRRMTYNEVKLLLTNDEAAAQFDDPELLQVLRGMNDLAQKIRAKRIKNGSIELNMKEYYIILDAEGNATGMALSEHDFSHELVEEYMLAGNVCLAEWAHQNGLPALHRIHESPAEDSMNELADFLNASGYVFKPPFRRERIQEVVKKALDRPEEHAINLAILKSFKQAVYGPAADRGHFALNFPHYMHFTSPIRRYPDLQLHQALDAVFTGGADKLPKKLRKAPEPGGKKLELLGLHCSGRERRAMKIEEAVKDFRRLELLQKSSEREFMAVITGIRKFGVFVEIKDYFVEGMLPRLMIEKKGYSTKEVVPNAKLKHRDDRPGFHLGQEVRVRIVKIDLAARVCDMELVDVPRARTAPVASEGASAHDAAPAHDHTSNKSEKKRRRR